MDFSWDSVGNTLGNAGDWMSSGFNGTDTGGFGNLLGSNAFKNTAGLAVGGFNAYNQYQAQQDAQNIVEQDMAMKQQAFNANEARAQRRREIRFS